MNAAIFLNNNSVYRASNIDGSGKLTLKPGAIHSTYGVHTTIIGNKFLAFLKFFAHAGPRHHKHSFDDINTFMGQFVEKSGHR